MAAFVPCVEPGGLGWCGEYKSPGWIGDVPQGEDAPRDGVNSKLWGPVGLKGWTQRIKTHDEYSVCILTVVINKHVCMEIGYCCGKTSCVSKGTQSSTHAGSSFIRLYLKSDRIITAYSPSLVIALTYFLKCMCVCLVLFFCSSIVYNNFFLPAAGKLTTDTLILYRSASHWNSY